mmetsp:Transcript_7752/g.48095  ORF Transcript_7752/g.48095 Transcript_7752/m.48095 type:complete len:221 (+) Transcript_7752:1495-2157(+)
MLRHPIVFILHNVMVSVLSVCENVDEEQTRWFHPLGHPPQEFTVILHVLKHLHRHDAVKESRRFSALSINGHVLGEYAEIGQVPFLGLCIDEFLLGFGVGNGRHTAVRILGGQEEAQRSPSTSQFQDILSIRELGTFTVQFEHGFFGFLQGFVAAWIEAAAVFEVGSQAMQEVLCGHFVMLFVGFFRLHRHRHASKFTHEFHEVGLLAFRISRTGFQPSA